MIDLKLLSKQADELLDSETDESLNAWLSEYNSKNIIATRFGEENPEPIKIFPNSKSYTYDEIK